MSEEFKIAEEPKSDLEKKIDRFRDMERRTKLAKHELADLEIAIGMLMQVRGALMMNDKIADDIDDHVEIIMDTITDMVKILNKSFKKLHEKSEIDE